MNHKYCCLYTMLFLMCSCGSVQQQKVEDPTMQARSIFTKLIGISPQIHENEILLVIVDDSERGYFNHVCLSSSDCSTDGKFEKTIVLMKSQLDRFQSVIPFVIAHKIAHVIFSSLGLKIDLESSELWADRLGFQLLTRVGEHPEKIVQTVCEYFALYPQVHPSGNKRCELLHQILRLHLYDEPIPQIPTATSS